MTRRAGGVRPRGARRYRAKEQGLALVITLFVVALVTVLVLEYHFDAAVELDLAVNYASDVQAYHLALAGVRFAQALLQWDDPAADGPDDAWYRLGLVPACFAPQQLLELAAAGGGEGAVATGAEATRAALSERSRADAAHSDAGCVSLRMTDEESKLPVHGLMPPVTAQAPGNVNAPADPNWVQIFQAFLMSFKIDPEVVDALSDWLDADDTPRGTSGAERAHYERLPVPYKPPDGRMQTPEELRLVKGLDNPEELAKLFPGMPPEAVADVDLGSNSYVTVFGAEQPQQARVNLNTATPEVLTALIAGVQPGNSAAEAVVQEIVARRQEKQFGSVAEAVQGTNLGQALGRVADVKSTHFRVESVGVVGAVRKKIVAVLKRAQPQLNQQLGNQPPGNPPALGQSPVTPLTVTPSPMLYFKVE